MYVLVFHTPLPQFPKKLDASIAATNEEEKQCGGKEQAMTDFFLRINAEK